MGMFWVFAAIFIAAALAFVLFPLLRKSPDAGKRIAQKELTIEVYRDQLDELENDLKIGTISQEQYDKARSDIERNLLEDVQTDEQAEHVDNSSHKSAKISAVVVALFVPVMAVFLYGQWGAGEAGIDPENAMPQVTNPEHQKQNIEAMVEQLQARLQEEPDDGEGWYMLARTYQFLKRYAEAVEAYKRAVELGGDQSADVLSSYADAVAMNSGRQLTKEAVALLEQALMLDPFHVKSLWLVGTAAYQDQDYAKALKYWERLLSRMEPGSQDHTQVLANVNEVRSLMGRPPMMAQAAPAPAQAMPASDASISGKVSLGGAVAAKAGPEDTVFVFARAAQGPRMPLAIVRKQVKDLPFNFTLNDAMAMNPSMKLSNFAQVVVGARISKTGNAMPQAGDLQGFSDVVSVGTQDPVEIIINSQVN